MSGNGHAIDAAIKAVDKPTPVIMEQIQVTIASTGRPFVLGFPQDMTDSELVEMVGWLTTSLRGHIAQKRPTSRIVIPAQMYQYQARLVRVIDGDTIVLDLDLGFYQWRLSRSYRLARINAPEMSTAEGVASKTALIDHLATVVSYMVTTAKADSFDRWIIEFYGDGECINDWLVSGGWAAYHVYK